MDNLQTAAVAKALGHQTRLRILRLLALQTECRGADVFSELPLAQSTVSEHLRVLKEAGLVVAHPEASGNGMVYCLDPRAFDAFIAAVTEIASAQVLCDSDGKC